MLRWGLRVVKKLSKFYKPKNYPWELTSTFTNSPKHLRGSSEQTFTKRLMLKHPPEVGVEGHLQMTSPGGIILIELSFRVSHIPDFLYVSTTPVVQVTCSKRRDAVDTVETQYKVIWYNKMPDITNCVFFGPNKITFFVLYCLFSPDNV